MGARAEGVEEGVVVGRGRGESRTSVEGVAPLGWARDTLRRGAGLRKAMKPEYYLNRSERLTKWKEGAITPC